MEKKEEKSGPIPHPPCPGACRGFPGLGIRPQEVA